MGKKVNVLDLFCGAGGMSQGFKSEGFNILLGIDFNKSAINTFSKNHKESKTLCEDLTKVSKKQIIKEIGNKKIDVIVGGPPCQGFSMAGKRIPSDPRNSLFKEYLRVVKEFKPKIFVMENVRGLLSMKDEKSKKVIDIILNEFKKIKEYNVNCYSINTADYGLPQTRPRIFIIGVKKKYQYTFPSPTHSRILNKKNSLKKWNTIKNIILHKDKIPQKYFYSKRLIDGFRRREIKNKLRGIGFGWKFLDMDKPSSTISARYWKDGAEALIKYNDKEIRKLTPKECALIQTFPKKFKFLGNEREVYQQIGNAVPVMMAKVIAKSIKSLFSI